MSAQPKTDAPTLDYMSAADRNIELACRFTKLLLDNPELMDRIPYGVSIVFLPEDDPDLSAYNVEVGLHRLREGRDVYFRHVKPGEFPPWEPPDPAVWEKADE